jgi:hypothetical protein
LKGAVAVWLAAFALVVATGCGGEESTDSPDSTTQVQGAATTGSCTTYQTNGNHSGVGHCSGYMNTGTFQVSTYCCPYCNVKTFGNIASMASGTSTVNCGSNRYATLLKIEPGPPGG